MGLKTHNYTPVLEFMPRKIRCEICGRRVPLEGCQDHPGLTRNASSIEHGTSEQTYDMLAFPGYRVTGVLGKGGFGTVFSATRLDTRQLVAIKLAHPEHPDAAPRLEREYMALMNIGPPHVPKVHEFRELAPGVPYLVMELAAGTALSERLIWARNMALADVAVNARGVLVALEAVHLRGYVHRDLKPENIFTNNEGRATLIDFGLAVSASSRGRDAAITSEGLILGTSEYMSPEQCLEEGNVDHRADIYSVGVIVYEMITGRPPFWGPATLVRRSHGIHRPLRPSALAMVPPTVEEVVLRCLAKNPNERFTSADEVREALDEAFAERVSQSFFMTGRPLDDIHGPEQPPVSSSPQERRHACVVAFQSDAELNVIQRRLLLLGGELAHASRNRFVAVYTQELGESPAKLAIDAAHALLQQQLCSRALVDRIPLAIRTRSDGSKRYVSAHFGHAEYFPNQSDPPGVFLSLTALDALGISDGKPVPGRNWVFAPNPGRVEHDDITMQDALVPRLFGCEDVLSELIGLSERAIDTRTPTLVTVTAERGCGKSHLAAVLAERLRTRDPQSVVLSLRAPPITESGGSSRLIRELLRMALDAPELPQADEYVSFLIEHLGPTRGPEVWPIAALGLGWLTPDAPPLRALEMAPGALRSALITTVGEALRKKASQRSLCIIVDDAHLAADTALLALEYAALAGTSNPIWICAVCLPFFQQTYASWGEQAAARSIIHMPPLGAEAMSALCRHLLKPVESVPERAVNLLVARAEGVPLMLVELIRGIKQSGMIRRHDKGGAYYLTIDEIENLSHLPVIEWVAGRELSQLSPTQRSHARLLSLLGPEIHQGDVKRILRRLDAQGAGAEFPLDPGIAAKQLVAAGLLVETASGHFRFRHPLIAEVLARSVPEAQSRQIHLAALQHYGSPGEAMNEQRLYALAHHAEKAGQPELAESAYLSLAEQARERQTYFDAEQFYTRALGVCTTPNPTVYRARGQMRYRLARYYDALADFSQARALLQVEGDENTLVGVLLDEATALDWMADYKTSAARVQQAKELVSSTTSQALKAGLLLGLGRSYHREGREEDAVQLLKRAAELTVNLGEEGYETVVIALLLLGFILQGLGRLDEAKQAIDDSIERCKQHHDMLHLAPSLNGRALIRAALGDKEGMIADFEQVRSIGSELGKPMLEVTAHFNLGEYLYLMNELDAAEPHITAALEISRRSNGPDRGVLLLLLARFRISRGDTAGAKAIVTAIRECEAAGVAEAQLSPAEDVLCTMVELCTRNASEEEWEHLLKRSEECSFGQEKLEVLEMGAWAALKWDEGEAARRLAERAMELASRMPNVMRDRLTKLRVAAGL